MALKVIKKWKQSFSSLQELFREINSMKLLDHENTIKILDFVDTEDSTITVMDYTRGGDTRPCLDEPGRMTEEEAQRPFRPLPSALNHGRGRGSVHPDLKPSNLLLAADRV